MSRAPGDRAGRAAYRDAASLGRETGTRRSCAPQIYGGFSPRVPGQPRPVWRATRPARRGRTRPAPQPRRARRVARRRGPATGSDGPLSPVLFERPGLRRPDDHVEVAGGARRGTPVASSKPTLPVGPQARPREENNSSTASRTCNGDHARAGMWRQTRAAARSSGVTRGDGVRRQQGGEPFARVCPRTPTGMRPAGARARRTTTQGARPATRAPRRDGPSWRSPAPAGETQ